MSNQNHTTKKEKQRKKRDPRRIILIVAVAVLLLFLIGFMVYHAVVDYYLGKLNIVTHENGLQYETQVNTEDVMETVEVELDHHGEMNQKNIPLICDTKEVKNILLLATDSRKGEAGLSDTMILLSLNEKTKKIVLCSFMRDMYAYYPQTPKSPLSGKYAKLNCAHAYGGPELTMAVMKENYNIDIDYYAKFDFNSFIEIADALGGIEMNLSYAEVAWLNEYIVNEESSKLFKDYTKQKQLPYKAGTYRLNGLQALIHARNRRVGSDYARTERQRDIIQQMVKQAKELSLVQLNQFLDTALPKITTNIPKNVLKEFVNGAVSYLRYEIVSTRFPLDNAFKEEKYNIIPDVKKNTHDLYEKIYGEPPVLETETVTKEETGKKK